MQIVVLSLQQLNFIQLVIFVFGKVKVEVTIKCSLGDRFNTNSLSLSKCSILEFSVMSSWP